MSWFDSPPEILTVLSIGGVIVAIFATANYRRARKDATRMRDSSGD